MLVSQYSHVWYFLAWKKLRLSLSYFFLSRQNCSKICAKCKNTGWSKVTIRLTWSLRRVSDNFINVGHETSWIIDEKASNSLNLDFRGITFNFLLLCCIFKRGHTSQVPPMNSLYPKSKATRQLRGKVTVKYIVVLPEKNIQNKLNVRLSVSNRYRGSRKRLLQSTWASFPVTTSYSAQ